MSIITALYVSRRTVAAFVVVGLLWGVFAAHVPVFKINLGVNDAVFGLLLLGSATGLVGAMWLAPRADRILQSHGMQAGAAALIIAWLLPAQMTGPVWFALSLALAGLASGLLDVVMNARVSELEARTGRSLMNANHAMFSVAYAVAAIISSFTRDAGVPALYVFAGFGAFVVLLIPLMRLEIGHVDRDAEDTSGYPFWPIALCGGIVLIAFMSEATVEAWSALHVERTLGGDAAQGALGPATLGLTMAAGRFAGQIASDRFREVQVVIWASALAALGAVIAATAPTPVVAYIGFGILGLGVSVIGPMGLSLIGKVVAPHLRTEAISRAAVIGFSGFFFAPVLMGLVSQAIGLRWAFACVAALLLICLPLAVCASRLPVQATRT